MSEHYDNYRTYLQSGEWWTLRMAKVKENPRCNVCQSKQNLHVHHIRYKNLHDCDLSDLCVLCSPCHDLFHVAQKKLKKDSVEFEPHEIPGLIEEYKKTEAYTWRNRKLKRRAEKRANRSPIQKARAALKAMPRPAESEVQTIMHLFRQCSGSRFSDKHLRLLYLCLKSKFEPR